MSAITQLASLRNKRYVVILCCALFVVICIFAAERVPIAWADAGGAPTQTPTRTPLPAPTNTPTLVLFEAPTSLPTLPVITPAETSGIDVSPLLDLAGTQAVVSTPTPTSTPSSAIRTSPLLICGAFGVVAMFLLIIGVFWFVGRGSPNSEAPE